jgi:carboxymethylenebutenolidase
MFRAPGIPATGKYLRIPMIAVVNIRGDKLYHEHIYWDQLTVLFQMGLMPEYLKFPYPLAQGKVPEGGKTFEYHVPGAGDDTAAKLLDETAFESNKLFQFKVREVPE